MQAGNRINLALGQKSARLTRATQSFSRPCLIFRHPVTLGSIQRILWQMRSAQVAPAPPGGQALGRFAADPESRAIYPSRRKPAQIEYREQQADYSVIVKSLGAPIG